MAEQKSKVQSKKLDLVSRPHNGAPGYQQDVRFTDGGVRKRLVLGGQKLLIFLAAFVYTRFIAPVGRRFGKSTAIPFLIMEESRMVAGRYYALVICASHDKAYEMLEYCLEMWGGVHDAKNNQGGMVKRKVGGPNDQRRFLDVFPFDTDTSEKINTAIRVYFVSGAHPHYKKIRGYPHHMNRVICDEYAQQHPLLRKAVFPMMADCGGRFLALGTTDEDEVGNDQFSTYYDRGLSKDKKYANWGCMNFPTMANPELSKEGVQEVINDCIDEDELQQEVYAKFLSGKGSVFANLDNVLVLDPSICDAEENNWPEWVNQTQADSMASLKKAADTSSQLPDVWIHRDYEQTHDYVMTADWAKERDHTIIGVYDLTEMAQVAVFRFHGDSYTSQLVWAKSIKDHYQAHEFHDDENSGAGAAMGDMLRTEYETGIIPHKFGPHNKGAYVRRGQIIFYEARISLINCPPQYDEFKTYRKILPDTATGSTMVRYSHPIGKHDDFVDSFLHVTEAILDGQREADVKEKSKGHNMVAKDGTIDMSYWEDAPTPELLEEMYEDEQMANYF